MSRKEEMMGFLRDHLPESDWDCYPEELFGRFADHALMLRRTVPWCRELEGEIFAHYVLFPRVNDEDLSFHREIFFRALWPRVKDLDAWEARALEVNRWCHEHASYQAQDERTAAPLTVYRNGSGRCGEESAFLVSALRSVGVPARQVYAPRWSHCDDNHAWVEVLCGDTWRFLGACEPEPVMDRGWFTTAASRAMLVHSRLFGEGSSPLHGKEIGRDGGVRWYNQTNRYANTKTYVFQAFLEGRPAAGAKFQLQILNEAAFHTIAVLTADEAGRAAIELGQGSLWIFASLDGFYAECLCGENGAVLHLIRPGRRDASWVNFRFDPPEGRQTPPPALNAVQKAERARFLERGNALRREWIAGAGNAGEIQAFLDGEEPESRGRLVETLSEKDLRDVSRETLEDHFCSLPPRGEDVPEDIYWRYAACPRIALEKLTPWRGTLKRWLAGWSGSPEALWQWLEETLEEPGENRYENLYWTPERIPEAGHCDEKSRRVLLAAALRTMGVPARLRPLDGEPEVWRDGGFAPVRPQKTGTLRLSGVCGGWSVSQWTGGGWRLLRPEGARELTLPAGVYRLVTSVRLPNGCQFASRREVALEAGDEKTVPLRRRDYNWEDLLSCQSMPALSAETLDGTFIPDVFRQDERPLLVLWLEEGSEPTEHILNELLERRRELEALPVRVIFLVRGRESLKQPTLAGVLAGWDRPEVLLDDWAYDLEAAARHLGRDPDTPPLAVVCGGGQAVYSFSGYQVGSVELLVRAAGYLCGKK